LKLNAIHLKFQNNDVVDDNVIDVDVVVNCFVVQGASRPPDARPR